MMAIGLMVGLVAAVRLPQWITTTALVITVIAAVALALVVICVILSRVVFFPAIVMIEGQSAGNALSRSMSLGKGNWYRVGAIVLFTYFVSLSLLAALALPVGIFLYQSNLLNAESITSPIVSILYTSLNQLSTLLCLPIWIISFTLLYFDSRVRKEAYDLDLIAREINPGFYWQPPILPPPVGHPSSAQAGWVRSPVQTSPLGLAGFSGQQSHVQNRSETRFSDAGPPSEPSGAEPGLSDTIPVFEEPSKLAEESRVRTCSMCGASLVPGASFCMNCGALTNSD
jgi:hypothetical protein